MLYYGQLNKMHPLDPGVNNSLCLGKTFTIHFDDVVRPFLSFGALFSTVLVSLLTKWPWSDRTICLGGHTTSTTSTDHIHLRPWGTWYLLRDMYIEQGNFIGLRCLSASVLGRWFMKQEILRQSAVGEPLSSPPQAKMFDGSHPNSGKWDSGVIVYFDCNGLLHSSTVKWFFFWGGGYGFLDLKKDDYQRNQCSSKINIRSKKSAI